jgi:putative transposase
MCRVLEVSPSGYYAWRSRGRSSRAQADAVLSERVKTIHEDADGTYGVARIHAELKEEQVKVRCKTAGSSDEGAGAARGMSPAQAVPGDSSPADRCPQP